MGYDVGGSCLSLGLDYFLFLSFFSLKFSKFYCRKNSELMVVYGAVKIATAFFKFVPTDFAEII